MTVIALHTSTIHSTKLPPSRDFRRFMAARAVEAMAYVTDPECPQSLRDTANRALAQYASMEG